MDKMINYTPEQIDEAKTKILKFILYQKRTEQEIRRKFSGTMKDDLLEYLISYLKELEYINDNEYIMSKVKYFEKIKNLSIREVKYKLLSKGIGKYQLEDFIYENIDELNEYETKSAQNIIQKKYMSTELEDIKTYLYKKGYKTENVKNAIEELNIE